MFTSLSRMNRFFSKSLLIGLGLVATSFAFANQSEPIYQYLPAEELKQNIEAALSQQQIDPSHLDIQIDDKGVVNASGSVESKEQADNITKIIQGTPSVYAVFAKFLHPQP
jgi:osmotically-inducible protein OsmY